MHHGSLLMQRSSQSIRTEPECNQEKTKQIKEAKPSPYHLAHHLAHRLEVGFPLLIVISFLSLSSPYPSNSIFVLKCLDDSKN